MTRMGLFTLCVSTAIVVFQATNILIDRNESAWSFPLVQGASGIQRWRPDLESIIASNTTSWGFNHSNQFHNHTDGDESEPHTLLIGKVTNSVLCLQAVSLLTDDHYLLAERVRLAYNCITRIHTPRVATRVIDEFNPHLILFCLACLHCVMCLARVEYIQKREYGKNRAGTANGDEEGGVAYERRILPVALNMPLWAAGVILLLLLAACCARQAIHSLELLRYPTILSLILILVCGIYYTFVRSDCAPDMAWELTFHLQTVAVPLAILSCAVYGNRQWPDLLSHLFLLSVAVNLLWTQMTFKQVPVWITRALVVGLTTLFFHATHMQFGPFDSWRYVSAYIGCIGLAPLYVLSLMNMNGNIAANTSKYIHSRYYGDGEHESAYHGVALMATNAALFGTMINLSDFF